jgi:hypothetical protein
MYFHDNEPKLTSMDAVEMMSGMKYRPDTMAHATQKKVHDEGYRRILSCIA